MALPTRDERRAVGKSLRGAVPRSAHAEWAPPADRADPVEILVESNRVRAQSLVPLRYARMAASPFAFLRGSALVMAHDLARTPSTGITVQICGDAHVSNFGIFASPERHLMFDLNDFDETWTGPFDWDVKRLGASLVVAARDLGMSRNEARRAVLAAVGGYRDWIARYAEMNHLDVWYSHLEVDDLVRLMSSPGRKRAAGYLERAQARNHLKALDKLTTVVNGRRQIVEDPPVVQRTDDPALPPRLAEVFAQYRGTLASDRAALFDRYRFVDFALKVVGVGSVGTRCFVALFQGPNGGPLFLQLKQAMAASPRVALADRAPKHEGQRVVEGQKLLQATGDVLLGWATDPEEGHHYFVRQLWDAKGSIDLTEFTPPGLALLASSCGWALARAHARTGDSASIAGYLGNSERFAEAVADFAEAYADQTELDHAALVAAIERGVVPVAP
jgi:uncharacterized protein (DUF2252 family)